MAVSVSDINPFSKFDIGLALTIFLGFIGGLMN